MEIIFINFYFVLNFSLYILLFFVIKTYLFNLFLKSIFINLDYYPFLSNLIEYK